MSITGNLRTMPLGDLVHWLSASSKTGTLVIKGSEYTKKLFFLQGTLAAVESDNPREMLGYYLVGWGHLDETDLRQAIEIQDQQGVMLGELIVRLGYLTTDEVDYLIRVKTEESIFDLIMWDHGEFSFLDKQLPGKAFLDVKIPMERLLYEGSRQRDERRRARRMIPDANHVPTLLQDATLETENDEEKEIVAAIDGQRSIEEIALACRLPHFTVLSYVFRAIQREGLGLAAPTLIRSTTPGQSHAPWQVLMEEINDRLRRGKLLEAIRLMADLIDKYSGNLQAIEEASRVEAEIERKLASGPLALETVIQPSSKLRDLLSLGCDPAESFVLSRVSGPCVVGKILGGLPGPILQSRVILHNLFLRGLICVAPDDTTE